MEQEAAKNYRKAGKILAEVQKKARKSIKPGQKLLEIAESIEKGITGLGEEAKPAFPVNLARNNQAAHYTPSFEDEEELGEKDVLKVDIGVHVDGHIADSAFTLDFSQEHGKLLEAAEEALENALSVVKPGVELGKIGAEIQKTIKGKGFNPVQNLSGHGLKPWIAHSSPSIPNIDKKDNRKLEEDIVFAIEPFATDGKGFVKEAPQTEIFSLDQVKPVRNADARNIMEFALEEYHTLPFAERWVIEKFKISEFKRKVAFRELMLKKCVKTFPILKEETGKTVTQAETTVMIFDGKVELICRV